MTLDNGDQAYRDNYIDSLRKELLYLIEKELTPLALRYHYSDVPLESKVKWKPIVLVLGNYSSGKSTLINEFLGTSVQDTGQAPTDDCFTVITSFDEDDLNPADSPVKERDGRVLLNDKQYPFEVLKKHGDRFASHFRLKNVRGISGLKNLAIIDTPGMLDSVSEKDRGYDYQEVIGDFAQLADLILILFDPHKAGTVRESYASLRNTLPKKSFEDRMIFVLNRIDECGNLEDLLRVYGTLCWNLSQMTGRKDIPRILLTHAPNPASGKTFLSLLGNQRQELQNAILNAPRERLDNLASFVEHHSGRILHILNTLLEFNRSMATFRIKSSLPGLIVAILAGGLTGSYLDLVKPFGEISDELAVIWGGAVALVTYGIWSFVTFQYLTPLYFRKKINSLEEFGDLKTQQQRDSWTYISSALNSYLTGEKRKSSSATLRKQRDLVRKIFAKGAQEIRSAINELSTLRPPPSRPAPTELPEHAKIEP